MNKDIIEELASLERWTKYMLDNMAPVNIERWREQINTPYPELSEKEKESGRVWDRKDLEVII